MFYVGVDLGKARDHTAIAIVERREIRAPYMVPTFTCLMLRYTERIPLRTSYPDVVERVCWLARHQNLRGQCAMAVDGTGVGAPVVDMLRRGQPECEVSAVNITGGEKETRSGSVWNVPKRDLMVGLQVLPEKRQLKIARELKEIGSLIRELTDVQIRAGGAANAERVRDAEAAGDLAQRYAAFYPGAGRISAGSVRVPYGG